MKILTDRKDPHDAVDRYADHSLTLCARRSNELNTDVDSSLLPESHNLGTCTPVPAYQCFICTGANKVAG